MEGYTVKIVNSNRTLSAKEKISFKDFSDGVQLDTSVTPENGIVINPETYVVCQVHNEKSDNKDYTKFVIVDKDGTKYITGSESFWSSFMNIMDEIVDSAADGDMEEWSLRVYKKESKNYKGKYFLTCSIL